MTTVLDRLIREFKTPGAVVTNLSETGFTLVRAVTTDASVPNLVVWRVSGALPE